MESKPASILSEKDFIAAIVSLDGWQKPIAEVMMKSHVICCNEATPIQTAYQISLSGFHAASRDPLRLPSGRNHQPGNAAAMAPQPGGCP